MNKREYKNFMSCSRSVMRSTLRKQRALSFKFTWLDSDIENAIGYSDTITAFATQFYGKKPSLPERRAFIEMYSIE